jgi:hypothetical protein
MLDNFLDTNRLGDIKFYYHHGCALLPGVQANGQNADPGQRKSRIAERT